MERHYDQANLIMSQDTNVQTASESKPKRKKRKYVPAVTPRLRIALWMVFGLFALLAANSIYLGAITFLEWIDKQNQYQDFFYICMQLLHLALGFLLITPFIIFSFYHLLATRKRKNKSAVRMGYLLLAMCIALLVSGVLLVRISFGDSADKTSSLGVEGQSRLITYWIHVLTPLGAIWLYWLHRLAGPPIKWRVGLSYAAIVAVVVGGMVFLKTQDPRQWTNVGAPDSLNYFRPSRVRTSDGEFISEHVLMNDEYCMKCHQDIYDDHQHSAHRFSSFNNPWYLASVMETRKFAESRDGNVQASRWCAGCHDPVPFFSGKFDDPNYDFKNDPTAHAAITCTVCHSITAVNSNKGNADYTIEEPIHYPFAYSDNSLLQWVNHQLVKAKPSFHKQMMLKDFHKTSEFCSVCHKVHLPEELNNYKFLRGQNHYDSHLLSGVSGHSIRSFYYPPVANVNCNECHMPRKPSNDFGSINNLKTGVSETHNHMFPSANTAVGWYKRNDEITKKHQDFLNGTMRVDIFGLKENASIDSPLIAPLRPVSPTLKPGKKYLLETIIRTMKLGHLFTQGTADSNEVWMDVKVVENAEFDKENNIVGGKLIGRSGGFNEKKAVDPWSHFVNVFMLDKNGNRINRRNAQDIFVPFYNHQIPPGAAQIAHYVLDIPKETSGPVTVQIKLQFRKFDQEYTDIVVKFLRKEGIDFPEIDNPENADGFVNTLPITTLATDTMTFNLEGSESEVENPLRDSIPEWQRWNDYGIALLLEGGAANKLGELKQAEEAFAKVESLGQFHGPINAARVYVKEGGRRLDDAVTVLQRAEKFKSEKGYPAWTVAWLKGVVNLQQANFESAIDNLQEALNYTTPETVERQFNFTRDYVVLNELGKAYYNTALTFRGKKRLAERTEMMLKATESFEKTIAIDTENVEAHYQLSAIYSQLAEQAESENEKYTELAKKHRELHQKYKPDEGARDAAITAARAKYPAANKASAAVVRYSLNRKGTFELPVEYQTDDDKLETEK